MYELRDIGFSSAVGIGGDTVIGTTHIDCLAAFEADPDTKAVMLIGEIGGSGEEDAAEFIATKMTKPVSAYVAGVTAPATRVEATPHGFMHRRPPPAGLLLRLGRRLRSTLMGRLVDLPLALTPVLELLARREIARILHYSSPRAATMSGICRCRLKGHGGSQETSNSRSQKHFLPHMFYSVP